MSDDGGTFKRLGSIRAPFRLSFLGSKERPTSAVTPTPVVTIDKVDHEPPVEPTGATIMGADDAGEPFGESYFMDPSSGSAYHVNNYLDTMLLSRSYFEMAEVIAKCFRPSRVLEIGCAAGPTLFHLNTVFGIETHGVDVSRWAVEHRLHPNVSQAGADALPFKDGTFDVVFSCHALEHLDHDKLGKSIEEMTRVATPNGVQFHLLPILGSGPYTDVFGSIVGLKADKTHSLLFDRARWLAEWARQGWKDTDVQIAHVYDNHSFEFTDCQFLLTRTQLDYDTCVRIARKNLDVARSFQNTLVRKPLPGLEQFLNEIRDNWK